MSWLQKIATQIPSNDLCVDVLKAVRFIVGGTELWHNIRKHSIPKYQSYSSINMQIADVIQEGDKFDIVVHAVIRRASNMKPTPMFSDQVYWNQWKKDNPLQPVDTIDSEIGHPLLHFCGRIEGEKPGMPPQNRQDEFPYPTDRAYMVKIGEFDRIDTPYEVATYIKNAIERFYRPGGDDDINEDSPTPRPRNFVPAPRSPSLVGTPA